MSICGGFFNICALSCWDVSPVRTAFRISGKDSPFTSNICRIPRNGISRFLLISLFNALSGDTYRMKTPSGSSPFKPISSRRLMLSRNAANVLPVPVGAEIKTFLPDWICGQPSAWGGLGVPILFINHSFTAGWKISSTSDLSIYTFL